MRIHAGVGYSKGGSGHSRRRLPAMARQDGVPSGIRHMVTNYRFRQSVWYPNNNARLSEVYCFFEKGEVIALENDCQLIN
jgi:hypothetical protein